jgi:hypothetical protein
MNFQQEIELYLRSRFTLIWVVSYEEERIITHLKELSPGQCHLPDPNTLSLFL